MASHTIDDPDDAGTKRVNSNGELFLGKAYEGRQVEYAVRIIDEPEGAGDDA